MRIIKQLSEDQFVIKMDESDLKEYSSMRMAHDYVEFTDNMGLTTEGNVQLYGKYASCANWIKCLHTVHIPIRNLIKVVLPFLNKHKYCQKEHLLCDDGTQNYIYPCDPLFYYTEDGKQVIAFQDEDGEYITIPFQAYQQIKKRIKAQLL